jgi:hypothetical protein
MKRQVQSVSADLGDAAHDDVAECGVLHDLDGK